MIIKQNDIPIKNFNQLVAVYLLVRPTPVL